MENGPRFLTESDLNTLYTPPTGTNIPANNTDLTELGATGITADGRQYRYVQFGGTSTINPGLLLVAPTVGTNAAGLAIPTAQPANTATGNGTTSASALASGSRQFAVTNGVTSVVQNQYQYVEIIVAAGGTYNLRLNGHSSAGNGGVITLSLADPIPPGATTLIPGTDTVNLRYSPFQNPAPSATEASAVGVTVVPVPNTSSVTYSGWVQTKGRAFVYATSGTKGYPCGQDTTNAGGFIAKASGTTTAELGEFVESYASGSSTASVNLNIPV